MFCEGSRVPGFSRNEAENPETWGDPMNLIGLRPAKGGNRRLKSAPFTGAFLILVSVMQLLSHSKKMTATHKRLEQAVIGTAGLGGLGSTVAVALARAGIGKLIIAAFDKVDTSNLNRQHYFSDQIGRNKVDALTENLSRINTKTKIEGHHVKLNVDNIPDIFSDAQMIAECFDDAQAKQMLVETVLTKTKKPIVVAASGLAGYGRSNEIKTWHISERLIMVGDGTSGIDKTKDLFAARVWIAASHQANAIIEHLLDS